MLVRKGNAFYEIDEDCMKRKGLQLPTEEDGALRNYSSFRSGGRSWRKSFHPLWNPDDLGMLRIFTDQFPHDVL